MPKDDSVTPNDDTHPSPIVPLPNVPNYVSELHPVSNTVPDSIIDENAVPEQSENRILSPQPGPSGLQQRKDFPLQLDLSSDSEDDDIQVVQEDIQVVKISRNKNSPKNNPNTSSKKRSIEEVDLTSENDGVSLTFDNRVLSKSIFTRDISRENSNDAMQLQNLKNSKGLLETTSCVLCSKWTDIYFHCTVCENYNLCLNCFMKNIVPHHHREVETNVHDLSEKPMNIEVSYETAKKYGVQECLKTLVHASTCSVSYNTSKCKFTNLPCSIMKRLIRHAKTCCYDYPMSLCISCKNYISLCVRHAKGCQENQCPVLLCDKINRRQQEQHVPEQQQLQSQNIPETTNTTTSREEFYRNHLEPTKNEMDQYIQPTVSQPQPSTSSSSTSNAPITTSTIDEAELNDLLSDLESDIERRRLSRSNSLDQPSLLDNSPNNMIEQPPPPPEVDPLLGPILAGLEPNVLKQWENDELLGKHSRVAMILFANVEHPELKFQYPSWNDRLKMIYSLWKNVNPLTSEKYRRKAERNIENQRRAINAPIANLSQDTTESTSNYRNQLFKLKNDELLGNQATIAMILYSNQNHPELKSHYPEWNDRVKQITKIWKNLPTLSRHQYVQNARQNRTASRIPTTNHNLNNPPQDMSGQQWPNSNVQQQPQPGPAPQNLGATPLPTPPVTLPAKKRYIPPYTPGRSASSIVPPPPSESGTGGITGSGHQGWGGPGAGGRGVNNTSPSLAKLNKRFELYRERQNAASNIISDYNPATILTPLAQQKPSVPQQNSPAQKQNPGAPSTSGSDKNKPANSSFNCSICFDPPDQMYMFLNCGHLPFCDSCSKQIMKVKGAKCPICREKVSKRVRAFFQQT